MSGINWQFVAEQKRLFNYYECLDGKPGLGEKEQCPAWGAGLEKRNDFFLRPTFEEGLKQWNSNIYYHVTEVATNRWSPSESIGFRDFFPESQDHSAFAYVQVYLKSKLTDSELLSLATSLRQYFIQHGVRVSENEIRIDQSPMRDFFPYITFASHLLEIYFKTESCRPFKQPQILESQEDEIQSPIKLTPTSKMVIPKVEPPKQEPPRHVIAEKKLKQPKKPEITARPEAQASPLTSFSGNSNYYLTQVNSKVIWIPADLILTVTDHTVSEEEKIRKVGDQIRSATRGVQISDKELGLIMQKPLSETHFSRFSASAD